MKGLRLNFLGCCALYAIDLKTHEMTKLIEPTSSIALSPDGQYVLTQRGAVGVEVFQRTYVATGTGNSAVSCSGCLHFEFLARRSTTIWRFEFPNADLGYF